MVTPNKSMKRTGLPITFSACAKKIARRRLPLVTALGVITMIQEENMVRLEH